MARLPPRISADIHGFCANCGSRLNGEGPFEEHQIGHWLECPQSGDHFAAVVKNRPGEAWLAIKWYLFRYEHRLSLYRIIKRCDARFQAGPYIVIRTAILIACILGAGHNFWIDLGLCVATTYALLDLLIAGISVAYVSRMPDDLLRSVVLSSLSYLNIAMCFAVYYKLLRLSFEVGDALVERLGAVQAMYFSLVTITTLGYGDITPTGGALFAQGLALLELMVGIFYLISIVSVIVSWVNSHPYSQRVQRTYHPPGSQDE